MGPLVETLKDLGYTDEKLLCAPVSFLSALLSPQI